MRKLVLTLLVLFAVSHSAEAAKGVAKASFRGRGFRGGFAGAGLGFNRFGFGGFGGDFGASFIPGFGFGNGIGINTFGSGFGVNAFALQQPVIVQQVPVTASFSAFSAGSCGGVGAAIEPGFGSAFGANSFGNGFGGGFSNFRFRGRGRF
jgi:hypothetical protein